MVPEGLGFSISNIFADISDRLKFTDRNPVVRWFAIAVWCLLPFSITVFSLPEFHKESRAWAAVFGHSSIEVVLSPVAALTAAIVTLFAVTCINRGWARSEQQREAIVIRNVNDFEKMPADLRGTALLGAVILLISLPALLFFSNELSCQEHVIGCLFSGPTRSSSPWFATSVDVAVQTATFSIPQAIFRYPNFSNIAAVNGYGRLVELLVRVLVQIVFVASILELVRIRDTIRGVVEGLRSLSTVTTKPLTSAQLRLGPRLVPQLAAALMDSLDGANGNEVDTNTFAHNAANAIGQIGAMRAIPTLKRIFRKRSLGSWPRQRALVALAMLATALKERNAYGALEYVWNSFVLFRLRVWCWYWIRRESLRAHRTGRPEKRVTDALNDLLEAARL